MDDNSTVRGIMKGSVNCLFLETLREKESNQKLYSKSIRCIMRILIYIVRREDQPLRIV